jgi:vitamin-K-epoxide reductase (warfarin-sensitive)
MIFALGLLGLAITLYAIHVERKAASEKAEKAFCDINDRMSCTRVLTSPYAKMVGKIFKLPADHKLNVPNTYYGVLFYIAIMLYTKFPFTLIPFREVLLMAASSFSLVACCGLAYIMYFKLKDVCIVCMATWAVNVGIFCCALGEYNSS